ncbi:hypothetical protein [Nocardioides baekrokdamisoli]|nr:hypothetical protein [Nocardioides baekrokdamisoli]
MQRSVIAVAAIALVGALAWWLIPLHEPSRWRTAIAEAPAGADRYSWTDWAAVRSALHHPTADAIENAAYGADLLETTALRNSSTDLTQLGFTLNSIDSELFVQSKAGDADILRLNTPVDPSTWKGWTKTGGYWTAPNTIVNQVLAYAQVVDGGRILITSNLPTYLTQAVAALGQSNAVPDTVSGSPLSAFTYSGSYACSALAMAHAGADDQASGQDLVARAGMLNPILSYTLARNSATDVSVSMGFDSGDQARTNAITRQNLAVGQAPGIGGSFTDIFKLNRASWSGKVATLDLTPVAGKPLMGMLATNAVLFATC